MTGPVRFADNTPIATADLPTPSPPKKSTQTLQVQQIGNTTITHIVKTENNSINLEMDSGSDRDEAEGDQDDLHPSSDDDVIFIKFFYKDSYYFKLIKLFNFASFLQESEQAEEESAAVPPPPPQVEIPLLAPPPPPPPPPPPLKETKAKPVRRKGFKEPIKQYV